MAAAVVVLALAFSPHRNGGEEESSSEESGLGGAGGRVGGAGTCGKCGGQGRAERWVDEKEGRTDWRMWTIEGLVVLLDRWWRRRSMEMGDGDW